MKPPANYNYTRFRAGFFDLRRFPGPRAGQAFATLQAIDAETGQNLTLPTPGRWLVLETGSCTCPMYARNVAAMRRLAEQNPAADFVLLYVREAHPGERIPAHRSDEEKRARARQTRQLHGEWRRIVVDRLDGTAHRAIGVLPNCVYLVNPAGHVAYRSDWLIPADLARILKHRNPASAPEHTEPFLRWPWPNPAVLLAGGWAAVGDLVAEAPALAANHWRAERLFRREGRLRP